jgi:DNA-binding LacI/PurR family transcriptional regulator
LPFKKEYVINGGLDDRDGIAGYKKLMKLKPRPDAVFCVNDPVAIGVFMQCKENNVKIPKQLAIVGFSDNPIASLIDPPLTTVSQPAYEMGTIAVKMLLEEITSKSGMYKPKRKRLKTQLVIRGTT